MRPPVALPLKTRPRHHPLPDRTLKVPGAPVEEARKGVGGHRSIGGFAVPLPVPLGAWWKTPKHREPACLITGHGGHHIEGPVLPNPLNCEAPVLVTPMHSRGQGACLRGHAYGVKSIAVGIALASLSRLPRREATLSPPVVSPSPYATRRQGAYPYLPL